jgi:hypothetical protein
VPFRESRIIAVVPIGTADSDSIPAVRGCEFTPEMSSATAPFISKIMGNEAPAQRRMDAPTERRVARSIHVEPCRMVLICPLKMVARTLKVASLQSGSTGGRLIPLLSLDY